MPYQEGLSKLLTVLPENKRKKILTQRIFKQYTINGFSTLKSPSPNIIARSLSNNTSFCEDFYKETQKVYWDTIISDDSSLPPLSIENYPPTLAYYLLNNKDLHTIDVQYSNLTSSNQETLDSNSKNSLPEKESSLNHKEGNHAILGEKHMPKYLGYILIENGTYYNFYPQYIIKEGHFDPIEDAPMDFPTKGNINLYPSMSCKSLFANKQLALFEFSSDDLERNYYRGTDRLNITQWKLNIDELKNKNCIYRLKSEGIYPIVHSSVEPSFSNSIISISEDFVNRADEVFLEDNDRLYGPFFLDAISSHPQIKISVSSNGTISGLRPIKDISEMIVPKIDNSRAEIHAEFVQISSYTHTSYDTKTDANIVQDFIRSLKLNGILHSDKIQEEDIENYFADSFRGLPSDIASSRKETILNFIRDIDTESQYFEDIASVVSNVMAQYGNDRTYRPFLEQVLCNPELSSKIQSFDIIREKVQSEQEKLKSIQGQISEAQDKLTQIGNVHKQNFINQQTAEVQGLTNQRDHLKDEINTLINTREKVLTLSNLEKETYHLTRQIENLNAQKNKLEHACSDLEHELNLIVSERTKQVGKIVDVALEGVVAESLFDAAAAASKTNASDAYNALAESLSSSELCIDEKDIVEYFVQNVQKYRPSYSSNDIINIGICLTQNFLTVFSGEPGTGKTSICNIVSHILGLTDIKSTYNKNPKLSSSPYFIDRYVSVSVERGWTSKRDFIGYYNPLSKQFEMVNKQLCDGFSILNAEVTGNSMYPFVILLDEANLSPMEYYWADFMNICDVDSPSKQLTLGKDLFWNIPKTLRFVATINNDHTTEVLSPRLLDRAFIINLPDVDFSKATESNFSDSFNYKLISWEMLIKAFGGDSNISFPNTLNGIYNELIGIFKSLKINVSPRSEKAIRMYWSAAEKLFRSDSTGTDTSIIALDYAISQKLLPRINGSGESYRDNLNKLYNTTVLYHLSQCSTILNNIIERGDNQMRYYQFF